MTDDDPKLMDTEASETRRDLVGIAWVLAGLYMIVFLSILIVLTFAERLGVDAGALTAIAAFGGAASGALNTPMVDIVRAMIRRYAPEKDELP